MIARLILAAALVQLGASAQLQLLQFSGTTATPVTNPQDVGTAAPGDTLDLRFQIKNLGAGHLVASRSRAPREAPDRCGDSQGTTSLASDSPDHGGLTISLNSRRKLSKRL